MFVRHSLGVRVVIQSTRVGGAEQLSHILQRGIRSGRGAEVTELVMIVVPTVLAMRLVTEVVMLVGGIVVTMVLAVFVRPMSGDCVSVVAA